MEKSKNCKLFYRKKKVAQKHITSEAHWTCPYVSRPRATAFLGGTPVPTPSLQGHEKIEFIWYRNETDIVCNIFLFTIILNLILQLCSAAFI
ncbi:hypothetical protein HPB48_022614 [Haemaphysalis longicornis]|uniref:Uncharacterized protein n=1 Tax=Haemaphysalis longicornis TaxID=44386 RepID=A0A9J6GW88_HAELO|nr:hypothetical protein HPB48_022614 [Haemaphysalis longicornis]